MSFNTKFLMVLCTVLLWALPVFAQGSLVENAPQQTDLIQEKLQNITAQNKTLCVDMTGDKYDKKVLSTARNVLKESDSIPKKQLTGKALETVRCAYAYTYFAGAIDDRVKKVCPSPKDYIVRTSDRGVGMDCWICGVVFVFIESAQKMAYYTESFMRQTGLILLALLFLGWILIRAFKLFGSVFTGNPVEFFHDFFVRLIQVLIVGAILLTPMSSFFTTVLSPPVRLTAGLTLAISEVSLQDAEGKSFASQFNTASGVSGVCSYCENMTDETYRFPRTNDSYEPVLDDMAVNGFLCVTCTLFRQAMPFVAIGHTFVCTSDKRGGVIGGLAGKIVSFVTSLPRVPKIDFLIYGWVLIISFMILILAVAFKVIDAFFRLGFVIVFAPIFIAAFPFPATRQYTIKAIQMILMGLFEFLGIAIAVGLIMSLFTTALGDLGGLLDAVVANDVDAMLVALTEEKNLLFLFMCFSVAYFGSKILEASTTTVQYITNISAPGGVGSATLSASVGGAKKSVAVVAGAVSAGAKYGTQKYAPKLDKAGEKAEAGMRNAGKKTGAKLRKFLGDNKVGRTAEKFAVGAGNAAADLSQFAREKTVKKFTGDEGKSIPDKADQTPNKTDNSNKADHKSDQKSDKQDKSDTRQNDREKGEKEQKKEPENKSDTQKSDSKSQSDGKKGR